MTAKDLIPKDSNGKFDPLAFIRTTWPILLAAFLAVAWLNQRMESPAQKEARIKLILSDWATLNIPPQWFRDDVQDIKVGVGANGAMLVNLQSQINGLDRRLTVLENGVTQ